MCSDEFYAKLFFKHSQSYHNDITWLCDVMGEKDSNDLILVFAYILRVKFVENFCSEFMFFLAWNDWKCCTSYTALIAFCLVLSGYLCQVCVECMGHKCKIQVPIFSWRRHQCRNHMMSLMLYPQNYFDTAFILYPKHLERFLCEIWITELPETHIGASEKHADDVISSGLILPKYQNLYGIKKAQSQVVSNTKIKSFRRYLINTRRGHIPLLTCEIVLKVRRRFALWTTFEFFS